MATPEDNSYMTVAEADLILAWPHKAFLSMGYSSGNYNPEYVFHKMDSTGFTISLDPTITFPDPKTKSK